MNSSNGIHKTVLLQEAVNGLSLKKGDVVVDATVNAGGHSKLASSIVGVSGRVIGIDLDPEAIKRAEENLRSSPSKISLVLGSYADLDKILENEHLSKVQGIVFDLGLSSDQLEGSLRGFSFKKDEPLLMTFGIGKGVSLKTASDIVNLSSEEELADIIYQYGEERLSRKIAKAIVLERKKKPIVSSSHLASVISEAAPRGKNRIHPATKTFQALRIAVNDELEILKIGLTKALKHLSPQGRMAVISFHSLEDRIVKHFFKEAEKDGFGKIITKKPIVPSEEEITKNPRSRSAKLRILEKTL